MKNKDLKFKIGFCKNKYLKGVFADKEKGHYVLIRNVNNNGTCDVNVITSLEYRDLELQKRKIKQVRNGNTYVIPYRDANFSLWSGINKTPIKGVKISNIEDIGKRKIKRRHNFFIGKFLK